MKVAFFLVALCRTVEMPAAHAQVVESRKSVPIGVGLSIGIPGAGQFYASNSKSSWIKGAVFSAFEIGFWSVYLTKGSTGRRFEKKYKNYADDNWSVDRYLAFIENAVNRPPEDLGRESTEIYFDKLHEAEAEWAQRSGAAEHHVFEQGRQQYYEMIYKYPEQFGQGWSDADPLLINPSNGLTGYTPANLTGGMLYYRSLRIKSNSALGTARTMTSLMIANRFLSAIDAAWTIRRHNRDVTATVGFRVRQMMIDGTWHTLPSLEMNF